MTKVAKKIGNFWGYVKTSVKNYWGLLFGVTLGETWATFYDYFWSQCLRENHLASISSLKLYYQRGIIKIKVVETFCITPHISSVVIQRSTYIQFRNLSSNLTVVPITILLNALGLGQDFARRSDFIPPNRYCQISGHRACVWALGKILSTSPGLVVKGDDSCSRSRGFESRSRILHGYFFTLICCKNCNICLKRPKINKKRGRGWPI